GGADRSREDRASRAGRAVGGHYSRGGGAPCVARARDEPPSWRRGIPRKEPLDAARRVRRERPRRAIGMAQVELVQLGPAAVGGCNQLAVRAPAEAAYRVRVDRDRALGTAAGRRQGPRLVRAGALIRDDGELADLGQPLLELLRFVRVVEALGRGQPGFLPVLGVAAVETDDGEIVVGDRRDRRDARRKALWLVYDDVRESMLVQEAERLLA